MKLWILMALSLNAMGSATIACRGTSTEGKPLTFFMSGSRSGMDLDPTEITLGKKHITFQHGASRPNTLDYVVKENFDDGKSLRLKVLTPSRAPLLKVRAKLGKGSLTVWRLFGKAKLKLDVTCSQEG